MSIFDKLCVCLTIPFGIIFIVLGIMGLFFGSQASFSLPPILGFFPFFVGWAMTVTLIKYWIQNNKYKSGNSSDFKSNSKTYNPYPNH